MECAEVVRGSLFLHFVGVLSQYHSMLGWLLPWRLRADVGPAMNIFVLLLTSVTLHHHLHITTEYAFSSYFCFTVYALRVAVEKSYSKKPH